MPMTVPSGLACFFFQAEDGIRDLTVTGVQTCALPILLLADTITGEHGRLRVGGVFIFIGFKPNTGVIEGHVKHDAAGYLITDEKMMTSLPGLFAAGDVRSQVTRQITTAVGDATTPAIALEKYFAALRETAKASARS